MALIHCPECGKEISDTNNACPFCGYKLKKDNKRKMLVIVVIAIVCVIAASLAVYSFVIRPNKLLTQAENLISRGKYSEADVVLANLPDSAKKAELVSQIVVHEEQEAQIQQDNLLTQAENLITRGKYGEADVILTELSDSERKTELVSKIVLHEAQEALDAGDYALAEKKITMLPEGAASDEIVYEIKTQQAQALLGQGRYSEADALYAELEQTEDVKSIREQLFYESRILSCAARIQDTLLNPDSMKIEEAVLLNGGSTLDETASDSNKEIYIIDEPTCLIHYSAKTRGGGIADGFRMFHWDDGEYVMGVDVDTLETDDDEPWDYKYMDTGEKLEYHEEQMEIAAIRLALLHSSMFGGQIDSFDLDRMNEVIVSGCATNVKMLAYNDIVPEPTLRIVDVTPEPTEEPTRVPTEEPTEAPTPESTEAPTEEPTEEPTQVPIDGVAPESPEDEILDMQRMLSDVQLLDAELVNGVYGVETENAVLALQRAVNAFNKKDLLELTGMCDSRTLKFLQTAAKRGMDMRELGGLATPESTEEPVVGTINGIDFTISGHSVSGTAELIPGENDISWAAEGDVQSYSVYLFDGSGNQLQGVDNSQMTGFNMNTDSMTPGEVYELRIGALPTNGTPDDIYWESLRVTVSIVETP